MDRGRAQLSDSCGVVTTYSHR